MNSNELPDWKLFAKPLVTMTGGRQQGDQEVHVFGEIPEDIPPTFVGGNSDVRALARWMKQEHPEWREYVIGARRTIGWGNEYRGSFSLGTEVWLRPDAPFTVEAKEWWEDVAWGERGSILRVEFNGRTIFTV